MIAKISFWVLIAIVFYTYLGYGALVIVLGWLKKLLEKKPGFLPCADEPPVTLIIAAFNEEAWLKRKIENSLRLDYPAGRLKVIVITDGSNDGSARIMKDFPEIIHLHEPVRSGKMAALNRAMKFVDSEIVMFSDANALLNAEAVREMARRFEDPAVGCVCGEKRVYMDRQSAATVAGEGIYWRFESLIKKGEARLGSCVSAAGELFAIRARLFAPLPKDTLTDDLAISLRIALQGYRIQYAPGAYAMETASADIGEEFKRKIRIAAGNLQTLVRMPGLLNPFGHVRLTFQYVSHKFLRSFVAPLCLIALLPLNLLLLTSGGYLYMVLFLFQVIFYLAGLAGYFLQKRRMAFKLFFVPLYIIVMNLSALIGAFRYLQGRQSVLWDKAERHTIPESEEG